MSEKLSDEPSNLVMGQYSTIEQKSYANGANHVYGVDPSTGKKKHLSHEEILEAYGHTSKERKDYNAEYDQSVLEAEEDELDAQAELDYEWSELQQTFADARQSGSLQELQHALDTYKSFISQFEGMSEIDQNAMLAELLNKEVQAPADQVNPHSTDLDNVPEGTFSTDEVPVGSFGPPTSSESHKLTPEEQKQIVPKFKVGDKVINKDANGGNEYGWTIEEVVIDEYGLIYWLTDPEGNKHIAEVKEDHLIAIDDEQSTMDKVKEMPTKLYLAVKTKLGEMSKAWKELPEKDKKRVKWIGGIAAGALLVAGAYMTMRGLDSGGADQSSISVDSSASPDVTSSDAGVSASSSSSPEVTDPSIMQDTAQATPEPSMSVDTTPTAQPSPDATTTTGGQDTVTGGGSDMTAPSGAEATPDSSNLTSAQEKFAESSAKYPWDAAHDIYGDKATDVLKEAVEKAQAAGVDIDTFGEGKQWMIRANGSWKTEDVVKALAEYMPRQ